MRFTKSVRIKLKMEGKKLAKRRFSCLQHNFPIFKETFKLLPGH